MHTRVWVMASLRLPHRWLLRHPDGQKSNGLPLQHHGEPDVLGQHCKLPRLGSHVSVCARVPGKVLFLSAFGVLCFYFRITQITWKPVSHCCASQSSKYETPMTISGYLYIKNIVFFSPSCKWLLSFRDGVGNYFLCFWSPWRLWPHLWLSRQVSQSWSAH